MITGINVADGFRQRPVFCRYGIACVVGGEVDGHTVPHVAPIGMMVLFFCMKCHFGHECESLGKIDEFEFRLQLVVVFSPHGP